MTRGNEIDRLDKPQTTGKDDRMPAETPVTDLRDLIAPALTRARLHRGYSKGVVGRALNVTRTQVAGWERGTHRPSDQNLRRLAVFLDQPLSYFLEVEGELRP